MVVEFRLKEFFYTEKSQTIKVLADLIIKLNYFLTMMNDIGVLVRALSRSGQRNVIFHTN